MFIISLPALQETAAEEAADVGAEVRALRHILSAAGSGGVCFCRGLPVSGGISFFERKRERKWGKQDMAWRSKVGSGQPLGAEPLSGK